MNAAPLAGSRTVFALLLASLGHLQALVALESLDVSLQRDMMGRTSVVLPQILAIIFGEILILSISVMQRSAFDSPKP
jgi:hypothetical protein